MTFASHPSFADIFQLSGVPVISWRIHSVILLHADDETTIDFPVWPVNKNNERQTW